MSRTSRLIDRRLAKALVLLQACMIPVSALIGWVLKDSTAALSAALGALVCWLATCYFSWQSFRAAGARASKPLSAVALFCGFMLVQTMTWVAPFWVSRQQKRV